MRKPDKLCKLIKFIKNPLKYSIRTGKLALWRISGMLGNRSFYLQSQMREQGSREQGSGLASRILVCKMAAWQGHYELNMKVLFIM